LRADSHTSNSLFPILRCVKICGLQAGLSIKAPQFVPKSTKSAVRSLPGLFSDLDIGTNAATTTPIQIPSISIETDDGRVSTTEMLAVQSATLVEAAGRCDSAAAAQAFEAMEKLGVTFDPSTFNAMIQANSLDLVECSRWLGRMQLAGWAPNTVTYSTLIQACAKTGALREAQTWFTEMEAAGLVSRCSCLLSSTRVELLVCGMFLTLVVRNRACRWLAFVWSSRCVTLAHKHHLALHVRM
jgi:pentatricopeptide repeat protein